MQNEVHKAQKDEKHLPLPPGGAPGGKLNTPLLFVVASPILGASRDLA